jgi:hypothetical protein
MKTEYQIIKEHIDEHCEGAITYDGCDSALVGIAKVVREDQLVDVAIYSYERLVNHFKLEYLADTENPLTEDEAEDEAEVDAMEWVDYNISGGYLGIRTPMIISME